jgi:hypothetical protein
MLATLITTNWKQITRNCLIANLQHYSMKRPKSGNLGKKKKKKSGKNYLQNNRYPQVYKL